MTHDVLMAYDVERVRRHFPSLAAGAAHFDGPGGTQVPDVVGAAMAATLTSAIANRGTVTAAEQRAEDTVNQAQQAMADLLGADPSGIVFGRSATQLCFDFSRTLAKTWRAGDEVVVTRLDHDSNIRPWVLAGEAAGAVVRWADFDRQTGDLAVDDIAAVLSERTALVAVTGASNLLGTRPELRAIADLVHQTGALLYVDCVHLAPHAPIDVSGLGADFVSCSPYKFLGPHCGVLAADPGLLDRLAPDKVLPATDDVPERFELGTLPYELVAATTAAVDFLAALDDGATGTRRQRILTSMATLEHYEDGLCNDLEHRLADIPGMRVYSCARHRTPTLLFAIDGRDSADLYQFLAARGVNAPAGSFYALEASRWLGLGDDGAVRAGLAPYSIADDIDRLVDGVSEFAS
jgi:cysteine desulfurase family protein (TIGR01976 family)